MDRKDEQTTIGELRRMVRDFVAERDWEPFHDPKNLSMSLAIEAAELMEHFQWLRSDQLAEIRKDREEMGRIAAELADITAYLLSFANSMGIDVSAALAEKMKRNAEKYPAETYKGRFR